MMLFPHGTQALINIGLVSSGKSTLINAFAGKDIMKTSNLSCTAEAYFVTDIPEAVVTGNAQFGENIPGDKTSPENCSLVMAEMPRITRKSIKAVYIDTPGVNDAMITRNRSIAYDTIKRLQNVTIIYVSKQEICGTDDDANCLKTIAEIMHERKETKWFAVMNGWDMANPKRDFPEKYREKISTMAEQHSLPMPEIYFVSALAAALSRKALAKIELSEFEQKHLERILRAYNLSSKIPDWREERAIGNKALRTVVYHSGIPKLEDALYKHLYQGI